MDLSAVVDEYLELCEQRRLAEAARFLADGAALVFPGGKRYTDLEGMAAGTRTRYRWVKKERDHYAVAYGEDGRATVVSRGTLYGENSMGVPFEGIRYVDVFVLKDGKILEQHVWNDLCESGVLQAFEQATSAATNEREAGTSAGNT